MSDFSHLQKLAITADNIAEFTFFEIEGQPKLQVRPTTQANKPYYNQLLARSSKAAKRVRAGGITGALIAENRNKDRELFPKMVVVGWSDVLDSAGAQVPFSIEACTAFLEQLPDWLFDRLRTFCGDDENFLQGDVKSEAEIEDTAGNSQSG